MTPFFIGKSDPCGLSLYTEVWGGNRFSSVTTRWNFLLGVGKGRGTYGVGTSTPMRYLLVWGLGPRHRLTLTRTESVVWITLSLDQLEVRDFCSRVTYTDVGLVTESTVSLHWWRDGDLGHIDTLPGTKVKVEEWMRCSLTECTTMFVQLSSLMCDLYFR